MIAIPELLVLLTLASFILFIIAFISILKNEFTGYNKIVWLLAVALVPLFGSIAYFVFGKKQRLAHGNAPKA